MRNLSLRGALPALILALALAAAPVAAQEARCHLGYGGETITLTATPSAMPYMVPAQQIGSYFLVRVVVEAEPVELAALKTYVYVDPDDGPVLIHQGEWPWPTSGRGERRYGVTGLQRVYEPLRDSELEYWCEAGVGGTAAAATGKRGAAR